MRTRDHDPPHTSARRSLRALLGSEWAGIALAVTFAVAATALVSGEPARVDLAVTNATAYDVVVDARSGADGPWTFVTLAAADTTTERVALDKGAAWTFRFSAQGHDGGTYEVTRDELEEVGWAITVPEEVEQALRHAGAPPTP